MCTRPNNFSIEEDSSQNYKRSDIALVDHECRYSY